MEFEAPVLEALNGFEEAMCDDLNTPKAASFLFSIINIAEKGIKTNQITPEASRFVLEAIQKMDSVFGVIYDVPTKYFASAEKASALPEYRQIDKKDLPENVLQLARRRSELKALKLFEEADKLRGELLSLGYTVKDKKDGDFDVYSN